MPAAVLHIWDDDGCPVVGVPLSNRPDAHAWLYADDYENITADHGARAWLTNENGHGNFYVRLRSADRGNLVMVARLVVGDAEARSIHYRDGDSLNLRTRNLTVRKQGSRAGRRSPPRPPARLPQRRSLLDPRGAAHVLRQPPCGGRRG